MHVAAVLTRKGDQVITATPDHRIGDIARILVRERIGAVVIIDDERRPVGILSERDIVRAVAAEGAAALEWPATELMTRHLYTGKPDDTVADMMQLMTERRIRHVPIVEAGRMVGLISIGDVVKARISETEVEVDTLRGFVASIG